MICCYLSYSYALHTAVYILSASIPPILARGMALLSLIYPVSGRTTAAIMVEADVQIASLDL